MSVRTLFVFYCVGFSLSLFLSSLLFSQSCAEKWRLLEQDLETTKAMLGWRTEELAKSREERRALEGDLDQIRNVAQHVVSEIFGSTPSTSAPAV